MRKILFLSILVPFGIFGQSTYRTLPVSDAIWTLDNTNTLAVSFIVPSTNEDTLIGSFIYKKVFVSSLGNIFGNGYLGCYRSLTNGFTYYVPKDSLQEFLLMDLNAQQGDTVFNVYYHNQNMFQPRIGNFIVNFTGYFSVGSFNFKGITMTSVNAPYYPLTWYESIGGHNGLDNQIGDGLNPWLLYCMSAIDTTWYPIFVANQICQLDLGMNDHNSFSQIVISPNPFTNQIFISNIQSGSRIFLYDIFGRMIFTSIISSNGSVEFSSSLIDGIYFLEIKDVKGKRIGVEKIIKAD